MHMHALFKILEKHGHHQSDHFLDNMRQWDFGQLLEDMKVQCWDEMFSKSIIYCTKGLHK